MAHRNGYHLVEYPATTSPYLPIDGSWKSFLASRSRNFRYNLNRKRRALERLGRWQVWWFENDSNVDDLLSALLQIERKSWKSTISKAITQHSQEEHYYKLLIPRMAAAGWLFANVLKLEGRPIAYSLGYRVCNQIGQVKTSFDHTFHMASPGFIVNASAI